MKRIIKEWFFINYCTQVVGMWDKSDLINGTNHIIKIQITNLLIPVIFITYAYFDGPSGIYVFLCVIPFILLIYYLSDKYIIKIIEDFEMGIRYEKTKRVIRIFNFFLGVLITVFCVLWLIFSFRILNYL